MARKHGFFRPHVAGLSGIYSTTLREGVGHPIASLFRQSLALIGDSRVLETQQHWKNAVITDDKGLNLATANFAGPGITESTVGTLEWRASDGFVRWTAPSDTAGPWVALVGGIQILDSGTAGVEKQLELLALSASGPGTDQTIDVTVTGALHYGNIEYGALARALNIMKWPVMPVMMGIGGMVPADLVNQAAWQDARTPVPGVDIHLNGTNGISGSTSAASMLADMETRVAARRALGRYPVLVGESARWGTNTITALTAPQLAILLDYNTGLEALAAEYGGTYVDTYTPTKDGGFSDGRPASGVLRDTVHPSPYGAQIIGAAIAAELRAIGVPYGTRVAGTNKLASGVFSASGGTAGTGVTGDVVASHSASRQSGDITATASLEARSDGGAGQWQRYVIAATSTSLLQHQPTSAVSTLAALGLAVGNTIEVAMDYDFRDLVGLTGVEAFASFTGTSPARSIQLNIDKSGSLLLNEAGTMRAGPVVIPTGATHVQIFVWIRTAGTASADIRLANERIEQVV